MDGNVETMFLLWMLCYLESFFELTQCMKKNMDVGWMFGETKKFIMDRRWMEMVNQTNWKTVKFFVSENHLIGI